MRPATIYRPLPVNFVGGPDTVVNQIRRCRELTGAGVINLGFNTPGTADPAALLDALSLFGRKVLTHIRDLLEKHDRDGYRGKISRTLYRGGWFRRSLSGSRGGTGLGASARCGRVAVDTCARTAQPYLPCDCIRNAGLRHS